MPCHVFLYSQFNKSMFVTCVFFTNRVQVVLWRLCTDTIYTHFIPWRTIFHHIVWSACVCMYIFNMHIVDDDAAYICACVKIKISAVIVPASITNICVMCVCVFVHISWCYYCCCCYYVSLAPKKKHCDTSTCTSHVVWYSTYDKYMRKKTHAHFGGNMPIEKQNYGIF